MFKHFYNNIVEPQKEQSWVFFSGIYVLDVLCIIFIIFVVFNFNWLMPITEATLGIINSTLLVNIALFSILIVLGVLVLGKEKIHNIGLIGRKIPVGIVVFYGFYIILNIVLLILNVAFRNPTIWYPYWLDSGNGILRDVGDLLAQIFGNVLFEEVLFRGFLWIQLAKKFTKLMNNNNTLGIVSGAVVSNLFFALLHIPIRLLNGMGGWDLVGSLTILFGIGMLFSAVYFITENLFVTMGVHVLNNISFALFYPIYPTYLLVIFITIVGLCIWGILKYIIIKKHNESYQ